MARIALRSVAIIPIPTEAGTHFPGQSKAPDAISKTPGELGPKLVDLGYYLHVQPSPISLHPPAIEAAQWQASPIINGVRNEANSLETMKAISAYFQHENAQEVLKRTFSIVLGGDCSITPAIFASLVAHHASRDEKVGLLYFDGDADLTIPTETNADGSSSILDSMTISHLTGRAGGLESMAAFRYPPNGPPLATADNIVLFGFDPLQPATDHWVYLVENQFKCMTRPTVQKDPIGSARRALEWLKERVDVVYVHFDVDAIDSGEFPLANYPHYAGLSFEAAMDALGVFLADRVVRGLTITEVNPNNDPTGDMVSRLVDGVVKGFESRKKAQGRTS